MDNGAVGLDDALAPPMDTAHLHVCPLRYASCAVQHAVAVLARQVVFGVFQLQAVGGAVCAGRLRWGVGVCAGLRRAACVCRQGGFAHWRFGCSFGTCHRHGCVCPRLPHRLALSRSGVAEVAGNWRGGADGAWRRRRTVGRAVGSLGRRSGGYALWLADAPRPRHHRLAQPNHRQAGELDQEASQKRRGRSRGRKGIPLSAKCHLK